MSSIIQIENLHYCPKANGQDAPEILRGIDLSIEKGSFVAIIGENGSGKTTLIKHLNGLLVPTKGKVFVNGLDTRLNENRARLQAIVGMVFQNPADQIVASTVAEDVAFGLENLNLPTGEIQKRVSFQLQAAGMLTEANRPPHLLSGGQIQRVALAGVLARNPQVILLDEPTSMIDTQARQSFLRTLLRLKQEGLTIIYVTHHLEETLEADQIIIMQAGRVAAAEIPAEIYKKSEKLYDYGLETPEIYQIAEGFQSLGWQVPAPNLRIKALLDHLPHYSMGCHKSDKQAVKQKYIQHEPIINISNLHYTYLSGSPLAKKALNGADLAISPASVHGIAGANGSGKSTLLQHFNGLLRPENGHVRVEKMTLEDPHTPLRKVVQKAGLVFQSPETQFFEVFVGHEIAYGPKQFGMPDVRERVRHTMHRVGLDFETFKDRRLETLSGGEKRKVALASMLVLDQDILTFDEPTAGLDPRARNELIALFKVLKENNKTIIIASHRLEEIAEISTNLSLMRLGKITHTGTCSNLITHPTALAEASLSPPLAVTVARALIEKNWPIDIENSYTVSRLLASIKDCLDE